MGLETVMRRDAVLSILRRHREELVREWGVSSLALFGSTARDEAADGSDVDLLVEFERPVGLFDLFRLEDRLSELLGGAKVDLVHRPSVIEELRDIFYGEAVDAIGEEVGVLRATRA